MGGGGHGIPGVPDVPGVPGITVGGVAGVPGMVVLGMPGPPGMVTSGVPGEPGIVGPRHAQQRGANLANGEIGHGSLLPAPFGREYKAGPRCCQRALMLSSTGNR